jgi:hypothetical protein
MRRMVCRAIGAVNRPRCPVPNTGPSCLRRKLKSRQSMLRSSAMELFSPPVTRCGDDSGFSLDSPSFRSPTIHPESPKILCKFLNMNIVTRAHGFDLWHDIGPLRNYCPTRCWRQQSPAIRSSGWSGCQTDRPWLRLPTVVIIPLSASERQSGVILERRRDGNLRSTALKNCLAARIRSAV